MEDPNISRHKRRILLKNIEKTKKNNMMFCAFVIFHVLMPYHTIPCDWFTTQKVMFCEK